MQDRLPVALRNRRSLELRRMKEQPHLLHRSNAADPDGSAALRVVLTGFMGAGKSTVGRLLAPLLGWEFFDADAVLTSRVEASIEEIFARHGELHFRTLEAELIAELLQRPAAVIALGGGAIEHPQTRSLIAGSPQSLLVYLKISLATSVERCVSDPGGAIRPVLRDKQALETRFLERQPLYAAAHLTISTEGVAPALIAERIADAVRDSRI
jgi:shikimate kinase